MAERRMPRGLLDPESEAIAEAYEASPAVRRQLRGLLDVVQRAFSLEPQEQTAGDTALDIAGGFVPGVSQAMALRDIERARRAGDPAGMAMAATEFVPFGRLAGMTRRAGPMAQAVDIPPELYHGSPKRGLTEIDPTKAMEVKGTTWFSDNPDVAEDYIYPREYGEILFDEPPGQVYKAALSMKNPLVVDFEGEVGDAIKLTKLAEKAKKEGHDGLIVRNVDDTVSSSNVMGTSYAVFDKNQIKLLTEK